MFNTVIQPTGIYGTYPGISKRPNNNGTSQPQIDSAPQAPAKPKKPKNIKKSIMLKGMGLLALAAVAAWTFPDLRVKYFGDVKKHPFAKVFKKPSKKFPELDPLRKAFVLTADFLDKRVKIPAIRYLRENFVKYNHR